MCTVLVLLRPNAEWPVILGANRDERLDRAFLPPGRHWPEFPAVTAPRDVEAGGTWLGINDDGVVATIVNGMDRLGPLAGKATRGGLVLRALTEHDARAAAQAVAAQPAERHRGFTLLVADRRSAFAITSDERTIRAETLQPGHHLITPEGCDVAWSPRYAAHFGAFRAATPPDPARGDWTAWTEILRHADHDDPLRAVTVVTPHAFGTVSSTLLALPAVVDEPPLMLFADGPPTSTPYRAVSIARGRPTGVEQ